MARKVSGGVRKNGPAQTAEKTQAAKLKAWNHMVPRDVILTNYYAHLVTNVQGIFWEKVGAVLQTIFLRARYRRFGSIPAHQKWRNGLGHSPFDNCPGGQEPATNATGFRGVFREPVEFRLRCVPWGKNICVRVCALKGTTKSLE